ncbi:hypothetical protein AAAW43_003746 [Cronobacter sakazakii]|uniref:hypothetical protein n=1 Tax=Cronobacter sakazakii TaxID=28141 RepID=UPI000A192A80|nr:hypothetical protein [Cronobacter sakazakii]ELY3381614.1 hypothetical protein [Cronobacter sakazakii]ELY3437988.1 hypothetical protein [Cronobacter sakazakii]ELY4780767.1 hypothetical protein [Cronobacter sakazakii]EMC4266662.1 hypothetical protein [Cronobacter sakazakii]EMC4332176.1 hypothetical protein [Cronobacter sakazakii]
MLYSPFSDSMVDYLSRDRVTAVIAAQVQFESGTAYVHSGTGTLVLGGYVYYGVGALGAVDDVQESGTTSPTQLKLTISGLDLSLFAKTLNERCVGRQAEIYLVAMDDSGVARVADLIFKGKVSSTGATAGETNALQYTVSNVFEDWQRPFPDRYTDESHQAAQPGDRLFRYVAQMAERPIYWGSKKDAPGFTYS